MLPPPQLPLLPPPPPQASTAGPLVYKFRMEGVAGQSTASTQVKYQSMVGGQRAGR